METKDKLETLDAFYIKMKEAILNKGDDVYFSERYGTKLISDYCNPFETEQVRDEADRCLLVAIIPKGQNFKENYLGKI